MTATNASLSFLNLPRELRDMIYQYCSPPLLDPPTDRSGYSGTWPIQLGPTPLLRSCKQIHYEAAPVFYGKNCHVFSIGWGSLRYPTYWRGGVRQWPGYLDNTSRIAPHYLKMIKRCVLNVEPSIADRRSYVLMRAQLQAFVRALGDDHSLEMLYIRYGKNEISSHHRLLMVQLRRLHRSAELKAAREMRTLKDMQNILEPLAEIYNVPHVSVEGCFKDFGLKLSGAIASNTRIVSPAEEVYKTRMIKVKGSGKKKQPQRYRVGKYSDSKLTWRLELLNPLPQSSDIFAFVMSRQSTLQANSDDTAEPSARGCQSVRVLQEAFDW